MTNYIPADKLIAEIERLSATEYGGNTLGDDVANGALDYVLEEIIPSLQQEQPEVELNEETLTKEFHTIQDKCFNQGIEGWQREKLIASHFYKLGLNARK